MWKTILVVWFLFILFLSFYSFNKVNDTSFFPHFDKVVHFILYFVLAMLCLLSGVSSVSKSGILVLVVCLFAIGGAIEVLQGVLTTVRTASTLDLLFNMLGGISAIGIYRTLKCRRN
ncbi:VanZ family protein [Sunxiuqinia sp. A32]|uniref:VanZ family protein n=1 Tax=Sunxiuqinia sp. A32 TaxID=3461496 RepID=UPI0040463FCA